MWLDLAWQWCRSMGLYAHVWLYVGLLLQSCEIFGCYCVCLMKPLGVNLYMQHKSQMKLVHSVTASCRTNHRKRGSWGWRKHVPTTATAACLYCSLTCIITCLVYSLRMQMGQWKIQQQIGKCWAVVSVLFCSENQCLCFRFWKHLVNETLRLFQRSHSQIELKQISDKSF